jgi:hypothetical protein
MADRSEVVVLVVESLAIALVGVVVVPVGGTV